MDVEKLYSAYPRHIGKRIALKQIARALERLPSEHKILATFSEQGRFDWMLRRVEEYAQSEAGNKGQYTPYPATFFSQSRYLDSPSEWGGKVCGKCAKHPESGITSEGSCWECLVERSGSSRGSGTPSSVC